MPPRGPRRGRSPARRVGRRSPGGPRQHPHHRSTGMRTPFSAVARESAPAVPCGPNSTLQNPVPTCQLLRALIRLPPSRPVETPVAALMPVSAKEPTWHDPVRRSLPCTWSVPACSTAPTAGSSSPAACWSQDGRIREVAPRSVPEGTRTIDLGDVTLLPGLMDMEVNLFMGGPNHASPLIPVQEDPSLRTLRAVANARRTLRAGFTTVRNLGLFVQTGGILLDVALMKAIDMGWCDGPRIVPGRARHQPDRRPPRPDHVPGLRPPRAAPHRGGGHRQRRGRGPQGGPVPDQVRRPAHQGQRVGWGDVAHRPGRRPPVLDRGAGGDRRRGPPGRPEGGGPLPRRRGDPGGRRVRASTASSTGRS